MCDTDSNSDFCPPRLIQDQNWLLRSYTKIAKTWHRVIISHSQPSWPNPRQRPQIARRYGWSPLSQDPTNLHGAVAFLASTFDRPPSPYHAMQPWHTVTLSKMQLENKTTLPVQPPQRGERKGKGYLHLTTKITKPEQKDTCIVWSITKGSLNFPSSLLEQPTPPFKSCVKTRANPIGSCNGYWHQKLMHTHLHRAFCWLNIGLSWKKKCRFRSKASKRPATGDRRQL